MNVTVMVGPSCITLCITREIPTSTATIGTIHTSETLKRRVLILAWPGACGPSVACDFIRELLVLWFFSRALSQINRGSKLIADSMVNTTTRPKKQNAQARLNIAQSLEFNQCGDQRDHNHIEHRPVADQLDETVKLRTLLARPKAAALHRDQQQGKGNELDARYRDAGDEK